MGLFWELMQHADANAQRRRADSLEDRVRQLESEVWQLKTAHKELLVVLEKHYGGDLNKDGKVGE